MTITVTDAGVILNDTVKVTATDIKATNGIIHVIDAVLIPPAPPAVCGDGVCDDGEACDEDCLGNIIEVATAAGGFETLLAVVELAGLTETLATGGEFTVLAPTDAAFDAVPEAALEVLLNDIDQLTNVLLYHVLEGSVPASVVVSITETGTLQGGEIAIDVTDDGAVILNGTVQVLSLIHI